MVMLRSRTLSDDCQSVVCTDWQERQISVVRELLNDKNRTILDDKDRERLAFLSTDYLQSPHEASAKRSLSLIICFLSDS